VSRPRAWLQAARPLAHANIAPPLALGEALAWAVTGRFDGVACALIHAFGIADHLFIVFANDVADRDADARNATFNAYSGGSRVLVQGKLDARALARASRVAAAAVIVLALALSARVGRAYPAALALAALGLLWAYSYGPRFSYRGGGELLQGAGLGLVLPAMGFAVGGAGLDALPWAALAPATLLGIAGNVTTALPDAPSDAASGKRTMAVWLGEARARTVSLVLLAGAVVLGPALLPVGRWSAGALVLAVGPAAALLAVNAAARGVTARDRRACFWFVTRSGAAIGWTTAAWAAALVLQRPVLA